MKGKIVTFLKAMDRCRYAVGAVCVIGSIGIIWAQRMYSDWQWEQRMAVHFPDRSPDEHTAPEPARSGRYGFKLPLCSTITVVDLTVQEATVYCNDHANFAVPISDSLVAGLEGIDGITGIDIYTNKAVLQQNGERHWFSLLEQAVPMLLREMERQDLSRGRSTTMP